MSNRLRFRVWDTKDKEYLDPNYFEDCYLLPDGSPHVGMTIYNGICDEYQAIPPKQLIVEQCIGLRDKNGVLIYEGDVVRLSYFDYNGRDYCMVGFIKDEMFGLMIKGVKGEHFEDLTGYEEGEGKIYLTCWLGMFDFDPANAFEVIGNIHEMEVKYENSN